MPEQYKIIWNAAVDKETEIAPIRIISGQFKDVVYNYNVVQFNMNEDPPRLSFKYEVAGGDDDIQDKDAFIRTIGDILVDIITTEKEKADAREDDS
jgi:hypothetical protein